ncbi:MAG: homocysteine S-methyltransferase family protein [Verrucomicrobiota bacterium]|jgi:5-methyltetrahydrofolate--homocysteine methyltransferase|nr:homocysteine S-methyltransferase family protein [Verrucomicrobiota bacterium]
MTLAEFIRNHVLLMDGAMGTQIQLRQPDAAVWGAYEGCNEWLNHSAPEIIRDIHLAYFRAGCDAVETNTFGASPATLGEYGLAQRARDLSRSGARIAREAAAKAQAEDGRPRFVLGSVGPGTRLPTLGQITFDELHAGYLEQMGGLLEGGADGLLIETCQDLLQIKAAVAAAQDLLQAAADKLLYVSVTVESSGTLLLGSSVGAVMAALEPYAVDVLGLNCATGPDAMLPHLQELNHGWRTAIGCMPNAGLPTLVDGAVHYPLAPEAFAALFGPMVQSMGLAVAGGCCGTTPAHMAALRKFLGPEPTVGEREVRSRDQVASLFAPMELTQHPPPLYVGERANATGSKKFRDALLSEDLDQAFDLLVEQDAGVAHVLDLSVAYAGRDEMADMTALTARAARECRLPLMVDSTQLDVVEAALKRYGGRMLINSIHFEGGEEKAERMVALARRYGAVLVALTIDEQGMAMTADRKVAVARRLAAFCQKRGLRPGDLLIDTLTFTVGSGEESLRNAARETVEAIRRIKTEMPDVRTLLGLSNISFGLRPPARKVLNSVFLDRCVKAGMDACIINTSTLLPLTDLDETARLLAEALLDNDARQGDPLERYIEHFEQAVATAETAVASDVLPATEKIRMALLKGKAALLESAIPELLASVSAEDILNHHLVPAMKEVGTLFNEGTLQLPFVLKSAETMKKAVDMIKPHFTAGARTTSGTMVLATVAGDVHDIGKNLVDIILSNNGYRVLNLGVKIPVEKMMEAVREANADVLGMSGLLVKSVQTMRENLKVMEAAGMRIPVMLGGAALTPEFVEKECQPVYSGKVYYCRDAFDNLTYFSDIQKSASSVPP